MFAPTALSRFLPLLSLPLVAACSPALRGAANFEGSREAPVMSPSEVGEDSALPPGHLEVGRLLVSCTLPKSWGAFEGELLSDLDCTEARLRQSLKETAAEVGGTLLVEPRCSSKQGGRRLLMECAAQVARADAVLRLGRE